MSVYIVQDPVDASGLGPGFVLVSLVLITVGVILFVRYRRTSKPMKAPLGALLVGVILLVTSIVIFAGAGNSTIAIRHGNISVSAPLIGNETYSAGDITTAFVANVFTGNLTLSNRLYGTEYGDFNEGVYTLSNGATAHVVSTGQVNLVIELNSGLYLVLSTSNTDALVADFAANVAPVAGSG